MTKDKKLSSTDESPKSTQETQLNGAHQNELSQARAHPSIFVNRFIITTTPDTLRLNFGETDTDTSNTYIRSSVTMTVQNAAALRDLLESILSQMQSPSTTSHDK